MGMVQGIGTASDRISDTLVAGLELEFGRGVGEVLAHRFLDSEDVDFHWDTRVLERWIGAYDSADDEDFELDRIAICGRLNGEWFCATMLVDGDAQAHGMTGCRQYGSKMQACKAMFDAN